MYEEKDVGVSVNEEHICGDEGARVPLRLYGHRMLSMMRVMFSTGMRSPVSMSIWNVNVMMSPIVAFCGRPVMSSRTASAGPEASSMAMVNIVMRVLVYVLSFSAIFIPL